MAARRIPGMSVAVLKNGQIMKKASYGLASVELAVPTKDSTLFHLASTTKEFTGVAIMALVEDGRLALDDPVRTYLTGLPAAWARVTVRHCLSHTSGLPDGIAPDQVNIIPLAGDRVSLLNLLEPMPVGDPGAKAVYNQTELMLLGDIIARVSGRSYESFIEERLLKPIGISDMKWGDSWNVIPGRASLYTALEPTADRSKLWLDEKGKPVFSTTGIHAFGSKGEPEWLMPAAGLNANIDSMARWEAALWTGKIIRPASLDMMCRPFRLRDGTTGPFGLLMMAGQQDGKATVSSGGADDDSRYPPDGYRSDELASILTTGAGVQDSPVLPSREVKFVRCIPFGNASRLQDRVRFYAPCLPFIARCLRTARSLLPDCP